MADAVPNGFEVTWTGAMVRITVTESGAREADLPHLWVAALPAELVEISLARIAVPQSHLFAWLFSLRKALGTRPLRLVEVRPAAFEALRMIALDRFIEVVPARA